ncbi:3054_t:CDS:2 [Acaulospora colombiana]|uniref:3054_t:CDS:1 n=1 Tax=Acaulospora colombiana TaxID=27376 RepID=A0ACA9L1C1_9GLOM|nr:3054_t:CDS:2 [Acaulospora colombiana]
MTGDIPTQNSLLVINAILAENPKVVIDMGIIDNIISIIVVGSSSNQPSVADTSIIAAGKILLTEMHHQEQIVSRLVEALAADIREPATLAGETKRLALTVFRIVGKKYPYILEPHLSTIVPSMILCANDRNNPVKYAAERALLYSLQLLDGEYMMQKFLSTIDAQTAKSVTDIHKRTLSKLVPQEQQRLRQVSTGDEVDEEMDEEQEIWVVGSSGTFDNDEQE